MPANAPEDTVRSVEVPAPFGLLVALVVGPIVLLSIPVWMPTVIAAQAWRERRFRRRMHADGRCIKWADLLPRLQRGDGTLIVEQAQKDGCRVWWTDQDVLSSPQAPTPPPESELDYMRSPVPHPFVSWCHSRFTRGDGGAALLTQPPCRYPPGFVESSYFRDRFPSLAVVMTVKQA